MHHIVLVTDKNCGFPSVDSTLFLYLL